MDNVKLKAKKIEQDIIRWFEDLHRIPEVGDQLPQTTAYIRNVLDELGIPYNTYSNSGIRAIIECGKGNSVIALRADMDALPIAEESGLPYASANGNMHACGHDSHVATLLGAGKILMDVRSQLKGKIVLLFQPAEETTGGAKIMIDEGCLKNPDVDMILNFHSGGIFPDVTPGKVGWKKGAVMSAADSFYVTVKGKGGHGAYPEECIDPIPVACQMIQNLQTLVSREVKSVHGTVISVGQLNAGTQINIIPDTVKFSGTIRTLDMQDRAMIKQRMPEMLKAIAMANRAEVEVTIEEDYPVTMNHDNAVEFFKSAAEKIVGEENLVEIQYPSIAKEDMAYYLLEVPGMFGAMGSIGTHTDGVVYPHHNSKFRLDEDYLYLGTALYAQCGIDYLTKESM